MFQSREKIRTFVRKSFIGVDAEKRRSSHSIDIIKIL